LNFKQNLAQSKIIAFSRLHLSLPNRVLLARHNKNLPQLSIGFKPFHIHLLSKLDFKACNSSIVSQTTIISPPFNLPLLQINFILCHVRFMQMNCSLQNFPPLNLPGRKYN
jgi:hypothetical protein